MSTPPLALKETPLASTHRALGARMVNFGGWDMPVNYGSQIEEHHAVRRDAGMFDVSHMCVIDLHGPQVRDFLRGLIANNIDKLRAPGKALYTCMLNAEGGVIDDLIVYFFRDDFFRLVVNAATADGDIEWIRRRNADTGNDVRITPRRCDNAGAGVTPLAIVAVQGPHAREKTWTALPASRAASENIKPFNAVLAQDPEFGELMMARTGYTGEDGFELVVSAAKAGALWNKLQAVGVKPAGLGARDTLRLEAGMNLYGQDMDATVSPLDAGLAWTVDLTGERDFVGKAALLEQGQKQAFVGLLLLESGGVLRAHQTVLTPAGNGEITSGTFSPTMQKSIALARVPVGVRAGDDVRVIVRDKEVKARVGHPLFVRQGCIVFE